MTDHGQRLTQQWDIFELALPGPSGGNPFVDVTLSARFAQGDRVFEPAGFYDGDGVYRVRFMPDSVGEWSYVTKSNCPELDGVTGSFTCTDPAEGAHGPVRVHDTCHFAYADGAPHFSIGTTCYAWAHQPEALQEQTLETLAGAPFNKLRMCVFPKWYSFNHVEPPLYPFEGTPPADWDFMRPNPEFFRHFERRVGQLRELGIEADLILLHPYDEGHWGFDRMPPEADDGYLRYVVARLAAYANVWWSMANEWDFMSEKSDADWDRMCRVVRDADPYGHLLGVHNGGRWYDHAKEWVTHASCQTGDMASGVSFRERYGKPVVFDEICYEGDIEFVWGNITAEEMVHRFWVGTIAGCYAGHGETYLHPEEILWWSKGGVLHGDSPARLAFLREVLEGGPPLEPLWGNWLWHSRAAGRKGEYYLFYFGPHRPSEWTLPEGGPWTVDVLDTWEMTVARLGGTFEGGAKAPMPARPHLALRVRRA